MNPVLAETGPLSLSVPITLVTYEGAETVTRGTLSRLPQSEGQLEGTFSKSRRQAFTSTPSIDPADIEFLKVTNPRTDSTTTYRVYDREVLHGPAWGALDWDTCRFELNESTTAPVSPADWLAADWDSSDWKTG